MMEDRTIIGLNEKIVIIGKDMKNVLTARIDTGATKSSIDISLVNKLNLGPVVGRTKVKSAHGITKRPVIRTKIKLAGRVMDADFTVADRNHMRYKVLVGQNILKRGFLIDPCKKC